MVETGYRREKILSLQLKDVDILKKAVTIFGKKTGERRTIPLIERALEVLKEREKVRPNVRAITGDLVFTYPAGRKVNIHTLRSAFEDALAKAGVQDFRFPDLRHTFATRLAQTGVDPYTIQKLMGHTSFTTTQRYAHHFVESFRGGSNAWRYPGGRARKNYHKFITMSASDDLKWLGDPKNIDVTS